MYTLQITAGIAHIPRAQTDFCKTTMYLDSHLSGLAVGIKFYGGAADCNFHLLKQK